MTEKAVGKTVVLVSVRFSKKNHSFGFKTDPALLYYDLYVLNYCTGGKPETKSDSMLVWAAHHDPDIDKRSMLLS